jgi:hypothetical protein
MNLIKYLKSSARVSVAVAGHAYVVVNSEEHFWLNGNKPDVFVVPDGCWESKQRTTRLYPVGK